jgi:hypothetical protein
MLAVSLAACNPSGTIQPPGYTPASLENQLANGARIYAQGCATSACHGTRGEGIRSDTGFSAWPLVGPEFQERHPNAQVVFDVVRSGGEPDLRALSDQEIYDSIAYELDQNQIRLHAPLTASNAFSTYGEAMAGETRGGLYPPSEHVAPLDPPVIPDLPIVAENGRLRLQVDQLAQASAIGAARPPEGGALLIVVLLFSDLGDRPLTVSPDHLRLSTPGGVLLAPQAIHFAPAIARLQSQTIEPYHGTAGLVIFALPSIEAYGQLLYDDKAGNRLSLALMP